MRNESQRCKHNEAQQRWRKRHPEYEVIYRRNHRKEIQRTWRINRAKPENKLRWLLSLAKSRSKKKGISFNITTKDLPSIPKYCPVFPWIKLCLAFGKGLQGAAPSIDRKNPKKGYVKGNVRIISLRANMLKSNATLAELTALIKDKKKNV